MFHDQWQNRQKCGSANSSVSRIKDPECKIEKKNYVKIVFPVHKLNAK